MQATDASVAVINKKLLPPPTSTTPSPRGRPVSRAAKIAKLAKNSPTSPKKALVTLFGHDVKTMSPVSMRGSYIAASAVTPKSSTSKSPFISPRTCPNVDEDDANFVLINSKYNFDLSKMSDHQKEVMRKRRSDIPALYQDLSQSQSNSNDLFASESSQSNRAIVVSRPVVSDDSKDAKNKLNNLSERLKMEGN